MIRRRITLTLFIVLVLMTGLGLGLTWRVPRSVRAQESRPQGVQALTGTGFTYQGRLTDDQDNPLDGLYDFEFRLYDSSSGTGQIGNTVLANDVDVEDGRFTVNLDFGAHAFTGEERWLEIGVRDGGSSSGHITLTPRQPLTPAPYALALPGMRTEPNATSPNVVGGFSGNTVASSVVGAMIGGGGANGALNTAGGDYSTVGGGRGNAAGSTNATVSGGDGNTASAGNAAIGGGLGNTASDQAATVAGGQDNTAGGLYAFIGGGLHNRVTAYGGTIAGGAPTDVADPANTRNEVLDAYATVGGGGDNQAGSADGDVQSAHYATIPGGQHNTADGAYTTVAGGRDNTASNFDSVVGGGVGNEALGQAATVSGGNGNVASGDEAVVPGGFANEAIGNYSLAAGYRAKAEHSGTFVWADARKADFASTADGQFLIRAGGGVGIGTNAPDTVLHTVGVDAGTQGDPGGHIALIEDTNNDWDNQVLAVKTGYTGDPTSNNNFVTFFNGSDTAVGAIEGNSAGGVSYTSGGADFAEFMPQLDTDEAIEAAEIVGVFGDAVSKRTLGAQRVLVVSSQPVVVGNTPGERAEARADYEKVALIGQVPVKVRGSVRAGEYIVPSGRNDGTGVAVSPEEIAVAEVGRVVGQALASRDGSGIGEVKLLVGLSETQLLERMLRRRDARMDDLEARIAALEAAIEQGTEQ